MLKTWSGPALAACGAIVLAAIELAPSTAHSTLAWWIRTGMLSPVRVLPMLGFGIALALAGFRLRIAALVLFGLGIAAGFLTEDRFVALLAAFPQAANQDFLTGPISCLVVGLALALGAWLRRTMLPFVAIVAGAMLVYAITVTDPSLHDPAFPLAGLSIALWIILATALTVHAFRRDWFVIPSRIVGSWLIAIGLLYGGVSLMPRSKPPALPIAPQPQSPLPGLDREVPGLTLPDEDSKPGAPSESLRQ
jgi:hypothetical protein